MRAPAAGKPSEVDSAYAWWRLAASLVISAMGGVGLWSIVVVMPAVEAEFGTSRAESAMPYTLTMIGLVLGNLIMGWLSDRQGILIPVLLGTLALVVGYFGSAMAQTFWQFTLFHGIAIGMLGSSPTFAPMIAAVSLWFRRRRGVAVAIAACGSYLAGAFWPPVIQLLIDSVGWRQTHIAIAVICIVVILPLSFALRRPAPLEPAATAGPGGMSADPLRTPLPPRLLMALLMGAGFFCCVAMAMPQVHIVACVVDLGHEAARGAEMLAIMLGLGVVSRLGFGWLSDRIGPVPTLLVGSGLQAMSLLFFLPSDALAVLYGASALFGLFQGGIVPAYAVIVRQYFPASEAGMRIGVILSATMAGMAFGGWISGAIYDLTLSYTAAFVNGFVWNLANMAIVLLLLWRGTRRTTARPAMA